MSGRKWFLVSMIGCIIVSLSMVYIGLFSQPPLSYFQEEEHFSLRESKKEVRATLSQWNPEYIRAYMFNAERFDSFDDFSAQLYVELLYYPSLRFREKEPDFFHTESKPVVLRFQDRLFFETKQTLGFRVATEDRYSLRINGKEYNDTLHEFEAGHHTLDLWVYHPVGAFDLSVEYTMDGTAYIPYEPGLSSSLKRRFGTDRTAFSISVDKIFQKGTAQLKSDAPSYLEELWFLIDEGRYWGRIVIEVHNNDGGLTLSQSRALRLSQWLVEKGSSKKQITVQGHAGKWLESQETGRIEWVLLH